MFNRANSISNGRDCYTPQFLVTNKYGGVFETQRRTDGKQSPSNDNEHQLYSSAVEESRY